MATPSLGQSESPHVTGSKSDAKPDEPTERLRSTSLTPARMATAFQRRANTALSPTSATARATTARR
jgi:hypothetical protein